ncbi:MAG: alpha amylase C-terminal domain-containing protein [Bacteroidales bacterium]|nr:alpha amylase C-terminal domain-containing protein [Bacteroidales bacterium]
MKKIYQTDPWLEPFKPAIDARHERILADRQKLTGGRPLSDVANNHLYYGIHKDGSEWVVREWAPGATKIYLIGDCNNWKRTPDYAFSPVGQGNWELRLPEIFLSPGSLFKLWVEWPGGGGERIPAYATRVIQDQETKVFCAQVPEQSSYVWKHRKPGPRKHPLIYECHIGMSGEQEGVATFDDFRRTVLPRVKRLGYNVLQIMALQEHPYYGSFGYQVSSFFALSSRFGKQDDFKRLVDEAHAAGIAVIMDIVHSHAVGNEVEGLGRIDGSDDLYFYKGGAGYHPAWGTRCFDYGKDEVKYFLLSNCKYWMEEYHLDGFRFDGVTSMLYWDHGLGTDFGDYNIYFGPGVDENAVSYLALANQLIHEINPDAITIAEDVSGMAGLAAPFEAWGVGFDFRMAMGIADHWIKWIKEKSDEQWSAGEIWWELTNKRADEKTVSYAECHDQALVGDKTIIFRLIDKEMYFSMRKDQENGLVDRGVALHKLIRLVTAATCGGGYLDFMGNEFGHPEWIDFPREGNGWSYSHARRLWSIADNPELRFHGLEEFDVQMIHMLRRERVLLSPPELLVADEQKQVLIFRRQNCIFALNFNPQGSFADYGFSAPAGEFEKIFDSDEERFGGFGRLPAGERHQSLPQHCPNGNQNYDHTMFLYLPSRCAIVLKKL